MIPPVIAARVTMRDDMAHSAIDIKSYEDMLKNQLISQIANELRDKVDFRNFIEPQHHHKIIEASVVAMSYKDFQANYGDNYQRRGISDGTMAIMQNGHWKVLGQAPISKVDLQQEKVYNKKSAVDYLTDRMRNS